MLRRPSIAAGARALATLVFVAPDAEAALAAVRAALDGAAADAVEAGASAWNRMLVVRLLAADAAVLRGAVVAVLATLRGARPLPRVWLC
jgi:urease accessory protein